MRPYLFECHPCAENYVDFKNLTHSSFMSKQHFRQKRSELKIFCKYFTPHPMFLLRSVLLLTGSGSKSDVVTSEFTGGTITVKKEKLAGLVDRRLSRVSDENIKQSLVSAFQSFLQSDMSTPRTTLSFIYNKKEETFHFIGFMFRPGPEGTDTVQVEDTNYRQKGLNFEQSWFMVDSLRDGNIENEIKDIGDLENDPEFLSFIGRVLGGIRSPMGPQTFRDVVSEIQVSSDL